jgi:hypothetical protein
MNLPNKQRGMSALGWLLLIAIVGGATTVGIRLVPHYLDFNNAVNLLESLKSEPNMINRRKSAMLARYTKKLKINGIYDFNLKEKFKIKRYPDKVTFDLAYEVREPIMSNMYVLLVFEHHAELKE